jgi:hypothetical protein
MRPGFGVDGPHQRTDDLFTYIVVKHLDDGGLLDPARLNSPLCERAGPGPAPHPLPKHATRRASTGSFTTPPARNTT